MKKEKNFKLAPLKSAQRAIVDELYIPIALDKKVSKSSSINEVIYPDNHNKKVSAHEEE